MWLNALTRWTQTSQMSVHSVLERVDNDSCYTKTPKLWAAGILPDHWAKPFPGWWIRRFVLVVKLCNFIVFHFKFSVMNVCISLFVYFSYNSITVFSLRLISYFLFLFYSKGYLFQQLFHYLIANFAIKQLDIRYYGLQSQSTHI